MQSKKDQYRSMYTLYSIAVLLKCGLNHRIYEEHLSIECNCESGFRITHKESHSSFHVINTPDKILICYNNMKKEMTYEEENNNIFSFQETFEDWLSTLIVENNKYDYGRKNYYKHQHSNEKELHAT